MKEKKKKKTDVSEDISQFGKASMKRFDTKVSRFHKSKTNKTKKDAEYD